MRFAKPTTNLVVGFILGLCVGIYGTKLSTNNSKSTQKLALREEPNKVSLELTKLTIENPALLTAISDPENIDIESVSEIIDSLDYTEVDQLLTAAFGAEQLPTLASPHIFAKNLLARFNEKTPTLNLPIDIEVAISTESSYPEFIESHFNVKPNTKLFAHLKAELQENQDNQNIFIKWIHSDSGEIILFDRKLINATQKEHWVSYQPSTHWKTGFYTVTYYQYTEKLEPLAHTEFYVQVQN